MRRYLVFGFNTDYPTYYPTGGFDDFVESFDTVESALLRIAQDSFDKWQIVDGFTGQVIHRKE